MDKQFNFKGGRSAEDPLATKQARLREIEQELKSLQAESTFYAKRVCGYYFPEKDTEIY